MRFELRRVDLMRIFEAALSRKIWQRLKNCQVQAESVSKSDLEEACRTLFPKYQHWEGFAPNLNETIPMKSNNRVLKCLERFLQSSSISWICFLGVRFFGLTCCFTCCLTPCLIAWPLDQVQRQMAKHSGGKRHKCPILLRSWSSLDKLIICYKLSKIFDILSVYSVTFRASGKLEEGEGYVSGGCGAFAVWDRASMAGAWLVHGL